VKRKGQNKVELYWYQHRACQCRSNRRCWLLQSRLSNAPRPPNSGWYRYGKSGVTTWFDTRLSLHCPNDLGAHPSICSEFIREQPSAIPHHTYDIDWRLWSAHLQVCLGKCHHVSNIPHPDYHHVSERLRLEKFRTQARAPSTGNRVNYEPLWNILIMQKWYIAAHLLGKRCQ
jgi:hypothetical protein